jgi:diacylglycerol kinase (ATP)
LCYEIRTRLGTGGSGAALERAECGSDTLSHMRAAAILGPECSPGDLKPFQIGAAIEWREDVSSAVDEVDAVLIFGGDGTIHHHLPVLVQLGLPVLVVPAGSGNDFARALGFRRVLDSVDAWRRFCAEGENVRAIDLGGISPLNCDAIAAASPTQPPRYFCSVAGIGLDAEVARRANRLPRWLRGNGGYVFGFAAAAFRFAAFPMKISVRGNSGSWMTRSDQPTILAACANTATFGNGMKIAPQARPDDGEFDVCVIGDIDSFRLFCMFPTVYFGRHLRIPEVSYFRARSVRIETKNPADVYADGEYVCRTPVEIGVQPAALKVLTP